MISQNLEKYLNGSRLSMNQVASRWGVSTPLLSQIKNGKKKPSLELGLKILRESGASIDTRKEWIEAQGSKGQELGQVYKDEKKERIELKLKSNLSELLESHPIMMDIFLDISLMGNKGFSWNGILKNYGEYGFQYVSELMKAGIVEKKQDRYFIVNENIPHALNLENSLGVMKNIFDRLKTSAQQEEFKGEFHFDLTDVSPEGYEELKRLQEEYAKKSIAIIKENEMPKVKGGLRVISQNIVSILQCLIIAIFIGHSANTMAQGGGLTGGGSGLVINNIHTSLKDLKRAKAPGHFPIKYPSDIIIHNFGETIKLDFNPAAFMTKYFSKKEDAVESMVEMNKKLVAGNLNNDISNHLVKNLPVARCKSHNMKMEERRAVKKAIQNGNIKPMGFKIEESYSADGTKRYRVISDFLIPCVENKD